MELFRNTIELVDMDVKDRHSLISKPRASSFEVTNKAMTKTTATAARTGEPITSKEPDKDEPSQSDRPIETETTVFIDGKFGTTEASQKEPSSYEVPRIEEPTAKTSTESKEPSSMKTTQIFLSG